MKLSKCFHCGEREAVVETRPAADQVVAECKKCGTKTKIFAANVKYCAEEEAEKVWNALDRYPYWQPGTYKQGAKVTHNKTRYLCATVSATAEPGKDEKIWKEQD